METLGPLLILIALLQIKHMFSDYFFQSQRMLAGRSEYMHMGRAQHAGVHAIGSLVVFLIMGTALPFLIVVLVLEWILHFHIDWAKARYSDTRNLQPTQAAFWRAAGLDQALHQLTYLAMAWGWAVYG